MPANETGHSTWWVVVDPTDATDAEAEARGLTQHRDLYQLRIPLPLPADSAEVVQTRPLRPGTGDEPDWIAVNNRAFASHRDQGDYTVERLHAHMAEPWFDPAGFLLHERDGRLAAFCWTKVHPPTDDDPALGEIFVIGVDPGFQGLGLGRALTVAGLTWLADRGLTTGMLYVDADNTPAVGLYDSLGFTRHHTERVYAP
jgi:mycothiol synthase